MKIPRSIVYASNVACFFFLQPFFKILNHAEIIMPDSVKKMGPGALIIANHLSFFDPFVIPYNLPASTFLRLNPYRFPTSHEVIRNHKSSIFIELLGAYDIGETQKEKMAGLFKTREFIADRQTILIFPEGKISLNGDLLEFQEGVKFLKDLAKETVFVRLVGFENKYRFNPFRKRKIIYSEVMDLRDRDISAIELRKLFIEATK